jgi:NAD(P)-dependent dehydrogenase (short-subunit alcohol dehydrogenase family)
VSRVVLVTGCSSGIGRSTAIQAARAGHTVVATMRDPGRAAPPPGSVDVRRLDVTSPESIEDCVGAVVADHGRLDVLVNNAGRANTFPTVEMTTMRQYRADFDVNFFSVVAMTRAALPHLRASRGRVVTVGSTRGIIGQPFNEAYSAAKFAVEGFLESLAPVAAAMGVSVVLVAPGPVLGTAFGANSGVTRESLLAGAGPYAEVLESYLDWVARSGHPGAQSADEVAEVVVRAVTDPSPAFRLPTSKWAEQYSRIKLTDPSGAPVSTMTASWLSPAGEA